MLNWFKSGPIDRPRPISLSELADRVLVAQHEYDVQLAKHYADMQDAASKLANIHGAIDANQQITTYNQPALIEAELAAMTADK